jgi:hypothetical protein
MPYLLDIYARYGDTNPSLFYLFANIAAASEVKKLDLPNDILQAFLEALIEFEGIAIGKFLNERDSFDDLLGACEAAMAFSGHCSGKLLIDILEQEGTKRTLLICPICGEDVDVTLFEEGAVTSISEKGFEAPSPPRPYTLPTVKEYPEHEPNQWRVVASFLSTATESKAFSEAESRYVELAIGLCDRGFGPEAPPEAAFSLIGSVLLSKGFRTSAHRFFRLFDSVKCNHCGSLFMAAKGWWGCALVVRGT